MVPIATYVTSHLEADWCAGHCRCSSLRDSHDWMLSRGKEPSWVLARGNTACWPDHRVEKGARAMEDFGAALRGLRKKRGLRQADLAAALDHQFARSTLANVEAGREAPSRRVWEAFSGPSRLTSQRCRNPSPASGPWSRADARAARLVTPRRTHLGVRVGTSVAPSHSSGWT